VHVHTGPEGQPVPRQICRVLQNRYCLATQD
jgi:hypothetical protein